MAGRPTKPAECRCSWATAASLPAYRSETTDTHRTLKSVLPPAESLWVNSFLASAPAKNQLRSMQLHRQCSTHLEQSTSRISPATLTSLQALQSNRKRYTPRHTRISTQPRACDSSFYPPIDCALKAAYYYNGCLQSLLLSVLWCCWFGGRKGIWPVKKGVVIWPGSPGKGLLNLCAYYKG